MNIQGRQASASLTGPKRYVIIGAGIAGVSAAEAIRISDPDAEIHLYSAESELPYYRMSLTRYLAGEVEADKLALHPQSWYAEKRVALHMHTIVQDLLPEGKTLVTEDGQKLPYTKLILTAGASPFVPPFPGTDLPGVMTLRTMQDANRILEACKEPIHVVCIGGGLLGLEAAGAIARHGVSVSVVESLDWLLPRQLDKPASLLLQHKIEDKGIAVHVSAKTQALLGDTHVSGVQLADGTLLPADLVLISAGVRPNLELARKAGLAVDHGILVDKHMQTSHQDIYAAGDMIEFNGHLYGLWMPAKNQGTTAGLAAAGENASFAGVPPSAKLKVLGIDMFSIGQFTPQQEDDILLVEETKDNYASFLFREGRMIGSILLGDARFSNSVKKAVEEKRNFSEHLMEGLTAAGVKELLTGAGK